MTMAPIRRLATTIFFALVSVPAVSASSRWISPRGAASFGLVVAESDKPRHQHQRHHRRHRHRSDGHDDTRMTNSIGRSQSGLVVRTLNIRGGDLGSIKGETLATILCGLASLDAITGILAPYSSLKWLGLTFSPPNEKNDDGIVLVYTKLSHHYMHGIGISSLCLVVSLMLTIHDVVPLPQALGYSLLVRLASTLYLLVSGESYELGMSDNVFVVLAVLLAVTAFHLLGGTGFSDVFGELLGHFGGDQAAMNMVKTISYLLAVHGYFLFSAPKLFVQRAVRRKEKQQVQHQQQGGSNKSSTKLKRQSTDDSQDLAYKLTTNLASMNGGYMALSSAVMYLLAHGLDPVDITGMTAIAFVVILQKAIKTIDISIKANGGGKGRFFGIIPIDSKSVWGGGMLISVMLGAIGAGCLSSMAAAPIATTVMGPTPFPSTTAADASSQQPIHIPDGDRLDN